MENAGAAEASAAAARIMAGFAARAVSIEGFGMDCTTSVGIAVSQDGRQSIQHILAIADGALYEAKRDGGNCIRLAPSGRMAVAA